MKCFRHPGVEAAVLCKNCTKPLCLECGEEEYAGETHVCSESCASDYSQRPEVVEKRRSDSFVDKIYATAFIFVLMTMVGGGISLFWIRQTIYEDAFAEEMQTHTHHVRGDDNRHACVEVFKALGITTWGPQFGVGAFIGAASAMVYLRTHRKSGEGQRD